MNVDSIVVTTKHSNTESKMPLEIELKVSNMQTKSAINTRALEDLNNHNPINSIIVLVFFVLSQKWNSIRPARLATRNHGMFSLKLLIWIIKVDYWVFSFSDLRINCIVNVLGEWKRVEIRFRVICFEWVRNIGVRISVTNIL